MFPLTNRLPRLNQQQFGWGSSTITSYEASNGWKNIMIEMWKPSRFFNVFGGMLPKHKIPSGILKNDASTLFTKMHHIVFFHDTKWVPTKYLSSIMRKHKNHMSIFTFSNMLKGRDFTNKHPSTLSHATIYFQNSHSSDVTLHYMEP